MARSLVHQDAFAERSRQGFKRCGSWHGHARSVTGRTGTPAPVTTGRGRDSPGPPDLSGAPIPFADTSGGPPPVPDWTCTRRTCDGPPRVRRLSIPSAFTARSRPTATTRSGLLTIPPSWAIGMDEVFDSRMVSGLTIWSRDFMMESLRSRFSGTDGQRTIASFACRF